MSKWATSCSPANRVGVALLQAELRQATNASQIATKKGGEKRKRQQDNSREREKKQKARYQAARKVSATN